MFIRCLYTVDTKLTTNKGSFEYDSEPGITPSQPSSIEILH